MKVFDFLKKKNFAKIDKVKNKVYLSICAVLLTACSDNNEISGFGWFGLCVLAFFVIGILYNQIPSVKKVSQERTANRENEIKNFMDKYEGVKSVATVVKYVYPENSWYDKHRRLYVAFYDEDSYVSFITDKTRVEIPYNQIRSIELKIDDETTYEKSGLGRAIVGGIIAGGAGAIVGATTGKTKKKNTISKIELVLKTNNIQEPSFVFHCFNIENYFGITKDGKRESANSVIVQVSTIIDIVEVIIERANYIEKQQS